MYPFRRTVAAFLLGAFVAGVPYVSAAPPAPKLAQVLASGNDTGRIGIVNNTTGSASADTSSRATASGTGNADAQIVAVAQSGDAFGAQSAWTLTGTAAAGAVAHSDTGIADAGTIAQTNGAQATVSRTAHVLSGNGVADATTLAQNDESGVADASSTATAAGGMVAVRIIADGTSANIILVGLPTSDPHVTGALWNDAGTLKVSAL